MRAARVLPTLITLASLLASLLASFGCGSDEVVSVPVGPTGPPSIRFTEPSSPGPACVSIGDDVDAHVPLLLGVTELVLRPPGACSGIRQCGHVELYADGVLNNEGAVSTIELLVRKLADPIHDGSTDQGTSEPDVLTARALVVDDTDAPLLDVEGQPVDDSVDLITVPNCCGNSSLDSGEECDDGNEASADGCDSACQVECSGVDTFEDPSSHHCYRKVFTVLAWAEAESACIAIAPGWELAALSSQAELTFADDVVDVARNTWVGATDQAIEDVWVWSNGEPWGFEPWETPEPNDSGDCARTVEYPGSGDDRLRPAECSVAKPYVCELTPAGS